MSKNLQEFQIDDGMPRHYFWACTRFAVLKGLRVGALMHNWNQMKLAACSPIPSYSAFLGIFKAFKIYDRNTPPEFELRGFQLTTLIESKGTHADSMARYLNFTEMRYLCDPAELQSWCSFEALYKNNPRLFGSAQCYLADECELKFVSGIWVRFEENPRKVAHSRFKLTIWISTLHWNGFKFNSGDSEDSHIGKARSNALRQALSDEEQASYELQFSQVVKTAQERCMPRMHLRNLKKKSAADILRATIEKQMAK